MKNNYHTHTKLCGHAIGNVEDYIKEAIKYGFKTLGMSDHGLMPPGYQKVYMNDETYKGYLEEINNCIIKYPEIKIYKSLEIEYFRGNDFFYKQLLEELDYLILGVHYSSDDYDFFYNSSFRIKTKAKLYDYCDIALAAMNSGLFKIIAHPDLFMYEYAKWDETTIEISKRIIECAMKNNVLLEINAQGIRNSKKEKHESIRYPNVEFFKLVKEYKAKVIVSSDAHEPRTIYDDNVIEAIAFAKDMGLEVVEEIEFKQKHF